MKLLLVLLVLPTMMFSQVINLWSNDVTNPDNEEYVEETAFNLGIRKSRVTQEQLDYRYDVNVKIVEFTAIVDNSVKVISLKVKTFDEDMILSDLQRLGYKVIEIIDIYETN